MPVYMNGLMLGLSLIMALGPQNIFLIRQGAQRKHVLLAAVTCFLCDAVLVTGSVAGLHEILELHPALGVWMARIGAVFLFYYGSHAIKQALFSSSSVDMDEVISVSRKQIILMALGFSLLNPHAIIDSLLLIGGNSSRFPGHEQAFLLGVMTSSLLWFSLLTTTTYCFANLLTRRRVWGCIEFFSGVLMIYLSAKLICAMGC
ncbi:LysE/ArgO family amino acid transporter [Legionella septentrionalis]|uniref:LysE/ArgO family amino acid transporter n=1 Tax=Legionella septentrionalis TaxID=2498109 RepID=UPI000F8C62CE|nr:LysE family transporter [Legionella septentrionalis]RUR09571.1 amino acid transporter [Legionella septentrionalis]